MDVRNASLADLTTAVPANDPVTSDVIQEVVHRSIDDTSKGSRVAAAEELTALATQVPREVAKHADKLQTAIVTTSTPACRQHYAETLTAVVEAISHPPTACANGLREASRIRVDELSQAAAVLPDELRVIEAALAGWVELAKCRVEVPKEVVAAATAVLTVAPSRIQQTALHVLGWAVITDSPRRTIARDALLYTATHGGPKTRTYATQALINVAITQESEPSQALRNRVSANTELVKEKYVAAYEKTVA